MREVKLSVTENNVLVCHLGESAYALNKAQFGRPMRLNVEFPPEWDRAVKVMEFYDRNHNECTPQVIENGSCIVPPEALKDLVFFVKILGKKNGKIMRTDKLTISQIGGLI